MMISLHTKTSEITFPTSLTLPFLEAGCLQNIPDVHFQG